MKVIRFIERGGFGIVEEVETLSGERLARKTFKPQMGTPDEIQKLKRRFEREVRIQSMIDHPNIMPIIESKLEVDSPWFTMPLASNIFVDKLESDHKNGEFDTEPWVDILAGVEELHRLGYVHRDLKPANVLFLENRWVISDFGLILPTMRDTTVLTGTGSAYGTRNYAAPEQAVDFKNTPEQADIYALGCILHDAIELHAMRVPFAQIKNSGPYGPILEKCTEQDPKRRFPTVTALRAILFDIWRTNVFSLPSGDTEGIIELLNTPDSIENWQTVIQFIENANSEEQDIVLRAVNMELIEKISKIDIILFARLISLICAWARGRSFNWSYVDVIGDRLVQAYQLGGTRLRCEIVLSTAELAVSHNRWHVMSQIGRMLGVDAEAGLIDRILIELNIDINLVEKLLRIERIVHWPRGSWHKKITQFLNERDSKTE